MVSDWQYRMGRPEDEEQLLSLYPLAFPEEDLLPLLKSLLGKDGLLSLVVESDGKVVGHIVFTPCTLANGEFELSLLGPLAVHPDYQRQGLGKALIRRGIEQLRAQRFAKVLVLGDPNYYGRSGFVAESDIHPPYQLPDEWDGAWQSLSLTTNTESMDGKLIVPDPWNDPRWWAD